MKLTSLLGAALVAAVTFSAVQSNAQTRQTKLVIDDNSGNFLQLKSAGTGTVTFPGTSGNVPLVTGATTGTALFAGPTTTNRTYTLPDADATIITSVNEMVYGGSNTSLTTATTNLFDAEYNAAVGAGNAAGAIINSTATNGTATGLTLSAVGATGNNGATGLSLTTTAVGSGNATGISFTTTGATGTLKDINGSGSSWSVTAAGTLTDRTIVHSPAATQSIAAAGTISSARTFTTVVGSGGAVTGVTVGNGSAAGQLIIIEGTDDVNTVRVDNGGNVILAGAINDVLGANDTLQLIWDGTNWVELSRSNN